MKYLMAVFFGLLSFALTLALNSCVKNISWLHSDSWIYLIAIWNAIINYRVSLWIYYDHAKYNEDNEKYDVCWIYYDKSFPYIEQMRHFIFNFIGMIIGWISLFVLLYRFNNIPKDINFIDLGLALFVLLGISGNLPWIATKANLGK